MAFPLQTQNKSTLTLCAVSGPRSHPFYISIFQLKERFTWVAR